MTYEFCTVTTRDHLQCEKKADYEWCKVYSKWNGDQHINTHF